MKKRRGNSLLEFMLLGIPMLCVNASLVTMAIDMWQYNNLAFASETTSRYAGMHGATCSSNGNNCAVTIGSLVSIFTRYGSSVNPGNLAVTFTDASGSTVCNPVSTCADSTTSFPSSTGNANALGNDVVISASEKLPVPFFVIWPGNSTSMGTGYTLSATSRQRIIF